MVKIIICRPIPYFRPVISSSHPVLPVASSHAAKPCIPSDLRHKQSLMYMTHLLIVLQVKIEVEMYTNLAQQQAGFPACWKPWAMSALVTLALLEKLRPLVGAWLACVHDDRACVSCFCNWPAPFVQQRLKRAVPQCQHIRVTSHLLAKAWTANSRFGSPVNALLASLLYVRSLTTSIL